MTISTVIALYNKGRYVQRALDSVLSQVPRVDEVIVVDDGSTDEGPDIVSAMLDERIKLLRQSNQGAASARNLGIKAAHGTLVAFLDADDYWTPGFVEAVLGLATEYPQAVLYTTGVGRCWMDGRADRLTTVRPRLRMSSRLITDFFALLAEGDLVTSSNVAVRRNALHRVGLFPEGITYGEDQALWGRLALIGPFACDCRVLAYYFTPDGRSTKYAHVMPEVPALAGFLAEEIKSRRIHSSRAKSAARYVDYALTRYASDLLLSQEADSLVRFLMRAPFQHALRRFGLQTLLPHIINHFPRGCRIMWRVGQALVNRITSLTRSPEWLVVNSDPCKHRR